MSAVCVDWSVTLHLYRIAETYAVCWPKWRATPIGCTRVEVPNVCMGDQTECCCTPIEGSSLTCVSKSPMGGAMQVSYATLFFNKVLRAPTGRHLQMRGNCSSDDELYLSVRIRVIVSQTEQKEPHCILKLVVAVEHR